MQVRSGALSVVFVVVAAVFVGGLSAARATVVVVPSLEELTHRSDVVIQAVVREVSTSLDERGRLITTNSLEVVDGLRGAKSGDVVDVQQLGGAYGERRAWIAGNHRFTVGEEVVFFGVRLPKDPAVVVPYGIGFGIFRVIDDVDGRHAVEVGSDGVVQVVPATTEAGAPTTAPVTPRHFESLDAFKANLRSILAGRNAPALRSKQLQRPALRAPVGPSNPTTTSSASPAAKE